MFLSPPVPMHLMVPVQDTVDVGCEIVTFSTNFRNVLPLTTMLRDEEPRGAGRVVSYHRDLEDNLAPH